MRPTPSRQAREAAGFTAVQAARRAGVTTRYLLACEIDQCFGYELARRLCRLYGCDFHAFIPTPNSNPGQPGAGGRSVRAQPGPGRRAAAAPRPQPPQPEVSGSEWK